MNGKIFAILLFSFMIFSASSVSSLTVVINSDQWEDMYLGAMYAGQNDGKALVLKNLADSLLKLKSLSKSDDIIILESPQSSVARKYEDKLRVEGFSSVETISYDTFEDLQQTLFFTDKNPQNILVLYPEFGLEAIAGAPLITQREYAPFFLTKNNKEDLAQLEGSKIIAGFFPIRLLNDVQGSQLFTSIPESNAHNMTVYVSNILDEDWAVITTGDIIDLETLETPRPMVLYTGSVATTAQVIKDIEITNFEVVGSELADVATSIETATGKDLKLLLKYARTYTGQTSLRGQLFDIDYVEFPVPKAIVRLEGVTYYPNLNTVGVTYTNIGNVNTKVFSTVEIGQFSLGDDFIRSIQPGDTVTFPYSVSGPIDDTSIAVVNTQFGYQEPLTQSLIGASGFPVIEVEPSIDNAQPPDVQLNIESVELDEEEGLVRIVMKNNGNDEVIGFVELLQNETNPVHSISTKKQTIGALSTTTFLVEVPYIPNEALLNKDIQIITNYGVDSTSQQFQTTQTVIILTEFDMMLIYVAIALLVIILFVGWFIFRKGSSGTKKTSRSKSKTRRKRK